MIRRAIAALALLIGGYASAGLIGGSLPANAAWRQPEQGIRIWVIDNGIHTDLVLPANAAGIDWRALARPADLRDSRYAGYGWVAIGWGERRFYLETPEWKDVRPGTIAAAAIGSDRTVPHIGYMPEPSPAPDARAIRLRPEEYRRLAAFIRASFRIENHRLRHWYGYDAFDAFYDAHGHYDLFRTCNSWTGAALRAAGVRVGRWTPFPVTVLGWF